MTEVKKYQVGQRVRIKSLKADSYTPIERVYINDTMARKYSEKEAEITNIYAGTRYRLDIDEGRWSWGAELFDEIVEDIIESNGNKVKLTVEGDTSYITVDDKYTLAVKGKVENIGVSIKSPEDEFDAEMGKALALYRLTAKGRK